MAQFHPIDYGPDVGANTRGEQTLEAAVEEHGQRLTAAMRNIGGAAEQTAGTYAQNVLHRQATEAMAKASEGTEKAIDFIENHPYAVSKDELSQVVDPETLESLWATAVKSGEITHDMKQGDIAPTHTIGRDLFTAMAKKSREQAAEGISLPGWRGAMLKTAEQEALAKQERWIDPKMAAYRVSYDRTATFGSARKLVDAAMTPEAFDLPIKMIETSPSFSPAEKQEIMGQWKAKRDTVTLDKAMANVLVDPVSALPVLKQELQQLSGPDAGKLYPAHDEKARSELAHHAEAGIRMAEAMQDHVNKEAEHADKKHDDAMTLGLVKGLLEGIIKPQGLFDSSTASDTGKARNAEVWGAYKTREGIENAYHIAESFFKNQEGLTKKDAPGAFQALTQMYIDSVKGGEHDSFVKKLFSNRTEQTPYGSFNFTQALSPESMKHFAEKAAGMADKEVSKEDAVKMEGLDRRLAIVMTAEEGGGVDKADFANPQERVAYSEMEQFVRDAWTREEKAAVAKGKHLTPEQLTTIGLDAAKNYRESGEKGLVYGRNPQDGISITTSRGDVSLPLSERTAMEQARRAVGGTGVISFQQDGREFYDNYKDIIAAGWKVMIPDEKLTPADEYQLFYRAQTLRGGANPIVDPAQQVAYILERIARDRAAKKLGGKK